MNEPHRAAPRGAVVSGTNLAKYALKSLMLQNPQARSFRARRARAYRRRKEEGKMRPALMIVAGLGISGLALAQPAAWLAPGRFAIVQSGTDPHTRVICITLVRHRHVDGSPRVRTRTATANPPPPCAPRQSLIQPV
jgi:hypothetical protein